MIQCSRKPAVAVLAATLVAGLTVAWSSGTDRRTTAGSSTLAQLARAIVADDVNADTWLEYAQRLQQEKRFANAAQAYNRVLEDDQYHHTANLQCALVLAQQGNAEPFAAFMTRLILIEPRLAEDIFGRPEAQRYLTNPRFQELVNQARVQSMD